MMMKLSRSETRATAKYMYVGHVFESLAQAVRLTAVPAGETTSRNTWRVVRYLCSVRAMGMKTAMEIRKARTRVTIRRRRMRAFNFWDALVDWVWI